jgi:deoxyadenosine/deoxycytidine kinase
MLSFEGQIAAGKTSLTNLCSTRLQVQKLLENYEGNPFLPRFYERLAKGQMETVALETELAFLLLHYHQLKEAVRGGAKKWIMDFALEKDLVYARMNLKEEQLDLFETAYATLSKGLPTPSLAILLDADAETIRDRMLQRGRPFEIATDYGYLQKYAGALRRHMETETRIPIELVDTTDLHFSQDNPIMQRVTALAAKTLA